MPSESAASISNIVKIWQEFEAGQTLESRFVQDLDKVELLLQMVEYEERNEGTVDLSEFAYLAEKVHLQDVKPWAVEILERQKRFWEGLPLAQMKMRDTTGGLMRRLQDNYYETSA
ncbi:hypothetical protein LTR56_027448 [Elasticomyces elasticus]|nr:hypothetical protein LTR56_027448 [Elasticomyces elasticus]KAK4896190.1 hypothetical protein LTR49_028164 [Elasticomyces elasticus]KAK5734704.1 hypothetical protein LTS12_026650 [Elasticomyces elasticus]